MSEVKRITIPIPESLKDKLELIAKGQKRSMSANLEHALEVYAALFNSDGKMLVPIDSILMGDLASLCNVTKTVNVQNKNEQVDDKSGQDDNEPKSNNETQKNDEYVQIKNEQSTSSSKEESKLGKEKTNANKGKFGKK